jgi:hypothetical protein
MFSYANARILLVAVFAASPAAWALPSFARKYKTSCTTCHVVVPKLNPFGIAFKNSGYRIPYDDEKFIKQEDVSLGAPAWKQVWPRGVWPASIAGQVPVSLGVLSYLDVNPKARAATDFVFPEHLQVHGAGTLGENASYLATLHFMFMEATTDTQFLRGHIAFHRLKDDPLLNLRVGRFEIGASPFSRFTKKISDSDYMPIQWQTSSQGFQFDNPQSGFELFGAQTGFWDKGGFEYSVGLVNGSNRMYDNNSQKDFYASASYKLGGYGLTGSREELTELKQTENYIDNSFAFGGYGYVGRTTSPIAGEVRFNRWGVKGDLYFQKLNVYATYLHGIDKFLNSGNRQAMNAFFIQGDYVLLPWVMLYYRYEQVLLGGAGAPGGGGGGGGGTGGHATEDLGPVVKHTPAGDILPFKRWVPGIIFSIRANVTLAGEGIVPTGPIDPALKSSLEMQRRARFALKFYF